MPKPQRKDHVLYVRCSKKFFKRVEKSATQEDKTVSQYVRDVIADTTKSEEGAKDGGERREGEEG